MSDDCSSATENPLQWRKSSTLSMERSLTYSSSPSSQLHDSSARSRSGTQSVTWCSTGRGYDVCDREIRTGHQLTGCLDQDGTTFDEERTMPCPAKFHRSRTSAMVCWPTSTRCVS